MSCLVIHHNMSRLLQVNDYSLCHVAKICIAVIHIPEEGKGKGFLKSELNLMLRFIASILRKT